jgi:hypothetical protein
VEDPSRVGCGQTARDVYGHVEGASERHAAASEPLPQRLALDELEHHIRHVALAADVVHGNDRRVRDGTRRPRLLLEEAQPLRVSGGLEVEDLHRDLSAEALVAGAEDLRHAAHPEGREQLVGAEPCPQEGRRFWRRLRR